MTSAGPQLPLDCVGSPPPRRRRPPAREASGKRRRSPEPAAGPDLDAVRTRAGDLALAVASAVARLQSGRGGAELRRQAQHDLDELVEEHRVDVRSPAG